jgi:DNA-binding PadR family transcriptional regulator
VNRQHNQESAPALQLTPAMFHILLALVDGERHGYAIMKEISARTGGAIQMGPGTLYRSIKQLRAAGLIVEAAERPDPALDDERRRYYRLTEQGFRAVKAEARRLEEVVRWARAKRLVGGET